MADIEKRVERIETLDRGARLDRERIERLRTDQMRKQRESVTAREQLVVDMARERGLLALQPRQIAELMSGIPVQAAAASGGADLDRQAEVAHRTKDAAMLEGSTGELPDADAGDRVMVSVKLSRNAGASKKSALERAGLSWHGNSGVWRGVAPLSAVPALQKACPGRVTTLPVGTETAGTPPASPPEDGGAEDRDRLPPGDSD